MKKVTIPLLVLLWILSFNNCINGNENSNIDNLKEINLDFIINGDTIIVDQGGSGDYTRIQDAINHSKDGDTIHVFSGNYTELLNINRSITLIGIGDPLLYHVEEGTTNIIITSNDVNIKNISIENKNDGESPRSNNIVIESSNVLIENINILGDNGIKSFNQKDTTITKCNFNCSAYSILFSNSEDISITHNTFSNYLVLKSVIYFITYDSGGISRDIFISNNTFSGNYQHSSYYLISRNTFEDIYNLTIANHLFSNCNKPLSIGGNNLSIINNIFYQCNEALVIGSEICNNIFRDNVDCRISGRSETRFHDNLFENNTGQIEISGTSPRLFNNTFKNNKVGLYIEGEERECVVNNNFFYRNTVGVSMVGAPNAVVWGNRFIDNDVQAQSSSISHRWYGSYPTGGNYWSDYNGDKDVKMGPQQMDSGSDGFGDTPYVLGNVRDIYPIFIDTITPEAVAGPDMSIDLGEAFHFDATDSTDDQMVIDFKWSFEYDGEEVVRDLAEFDFQFDIAGVYDSELTVSDFAGNEDTDSFTLTVEDRSPPVVVTQGNLTVNQGELAYFSALGTTDLSPISEYKWTFQHEGKEEVLKGPDVSFRFTEVGVHEIQLKVTDSEGNIGYSYFYVTVIDTEDPVAVPGPDIELENGEVADFYGSGSTDNDVIDVYFWTFKYGGRTETLTGETTSFLFNIPGYYTVSLTVTDANENSHSSTLQVTVLDTIDPEAVITGRTKLMEGDSLSLDGLSSTDNGRIVKYVWNFTDGEDKIIEGPYLNHTFERQGYIDVTLTVFDQWDNSNSKVVTVEVPDTERPKASAGDDMTVKKGTTITLDGSSSTDNGGISSFKWKFDYNGEDQVLDGKIVTFTFDKAGEYEIELTVTDHFLNRGTDKITIKVLDNGTLSGIVQDGDGKPIQGAKVTVTDSDGNEYTVITGTDGSFLVSVPEGQVTWKIEKSGYRSLEGASSIEIMEDTELSSSDTMMKRSESDGGSPIIPIIVALLAVIILAGAIIGFIVVKKGSGKEKTVDPVEEQSMVEPENEFDVNDI